MCSGFSSSTRCTSVVPCGTINDVGVEVGGDCQRTDAYWLAGVGVFRLPSPTMPLNGFNVHRWSRRLFGDFFFFVLSGIFFPGLDRLIAGCRFKWV